MALEAGDKEYAVVKHMANCHPNTQWSFKFDLHGSWKSSLERQVREAMLIDGTPREHLMNSKSEWGNNSIPRVIIGQDKDRDRDNGDGGAGGTKRILDREKDRAWGQNGQAKRKKIGPTENSNSDWSPNQSSSSQLQLKLTNLFWKSEVVVNVQNQSWND